MAASPAVVPRPGPIKTAQGIVGARILALGKAGGCFSTDDGDLEVTDAADEDWCRAVVRQAPRRLMHAGGKRSPVRLQCPWPPGSRGVCTQTVTSCSPARSNRSQNGNV